ncbi:hypothetical protein ACOMHN_029921 [Nucella lapillus]
MTGKRATSLCSLRKDILHLHELYQNRGLLTGPVRCRADMYLRLSYYHHLLAKLRDFYNNTQGLSTQPYITPLAELLSSMKILMQVLEENCLDEEEDNPSSVNCSAMILNPTMPGAITSVDFDNADDGHDWGSSLAELLLARLESLAADGEQLCSSRRRKSVQGRKRKGRRGNGQRARRSKKKRQGGRRIQEDIEEDIADEEELTQPSDVEVRGKNDDALSTTDRTTDSNNNNNNNDNINSDISNKLPNDNKAVFATNRPPSRKGNADKDGVTKRNQRRKNRRGRKNKGKGRKGKGRRGKGRKGKGKRGKGRKGKGNRGKGRKGKGNRGKGRKNKQNRQRKRQGNMRKRGGRQNRKRNVNQ